MAGSTMDKRLAKLLEEALAHQKLFESSGYIVKDSYPILYFGDYENYLASKIKVVTVGLNPSKGEFPDENRFQRFPEIKSRKFSEYKDAYNNYFRTDKKRDPYIKWFDSYKKLLNGIECSYSDTEEFPNRALHTDICSPLATDPTWSSLPEDFKQELMIIGVPLWRELVKLLNPDVIICSFSKKIRDRIPFDLVEEWEEFPSKTKKDVMKARINSDGSCLTILWGRNNSIGPFCVSEKEDIGKRILKEVEDNG